MMNDVPHNKGVLVFGNGLGGGIQKADRGDRCACFASRRFCRSPAARLAFDQRLRLLLVSPAGFCCGSQQVRVAQPSRGRDH